MKSQITNTDNRNIFLVSFATVFVFLVDLFTSRGLNEGFLYMIPILCTIWISGNRFTIIISISSIILTGLGIYFSPEGIAFEIALVNRLYAILGIAITMYVILKNKEKEKIMNQQNAELVKSVRDLKNANFDLEQYAYVASHDLQEPLRKIQTFGKLILEREKFSDKTQEYFNRIISASERMQNLIVSLLSYSQTNTAELIFVPCDLNTIMEESKNDLNLCLSEKQAIIEYKNLPTINGVRVQIAQLFTNLIDNAIKYSRPSIRPHIKITAELVPGKEIAHPSANEQNEYHALKITDNGIGFENEYATKIFELFQRLHGKKEYIGTGIGLAIVKNIVTNHNGFITAEGKPGIGSTFTIYIPRA